VSEREERKERAGAGTVLGRGLVTARLENKRKRKKNKKKKNGPGPLLFSFGPRGVFRK
jgi:hypothetical protein